jgi:hypothetical protein
VACNGKDSALVLGIGGRELRGVESIGSSPNGVAQYRQAHLAVIVAQNIVKRWRYAWEWRLGFSSVFAKIPREGLLIYRGFAPR